MSEIAQKFGGAWSLLKVALVEKYLRAFNVVLREKPSPARSFRRVYIDTFAGSGSFIFEEEMPLLPAPEAERLQAGSAKRAMAMQPGFDGGWKRANDRHLQVQASQPARSGSRRCWYGCWYQGSTSLQAIEFHGDLSADWVLMGQRRLKPQVVPTFSKVGWLPLVASPRATDPASSHCSDRARRPTACHRAQQGIDA
jgi:hypothetical protein